MRRLTGETGEGRVIGNYALLPSRPRRPLRKTRAALFKQADSLPSATAGCHRP